jgi:hypothetical protein
LRAQHTKELICDSVGHLEEMVFGFLKHLHLLNHHGVIGPCKIEIISNQKAKRLKLKSHLNTNQDSRKAGSIGSSIIQEITSC